MINYFYNIAIKGDECDFYTDVLTSVRKDYITSKVKQKGKIAQNSDGDTVFYEFCIDKNKPMKWNVSNDITIISDVKNVEDDKYFVNYYSDEGISKILTFSKYHTLLKVEYFNVATSQVPTYVLEPRKNKNDLCLLFSKKSSYLKTILYPMPEINDEYIAEIVDSEFEDYTAVASTNIGVVKFLSEEQISVFEEFLLKVEERKANEFAPESFIDESDAALAHKLNPKDFNIRKNLAQSVDITQAQEFSLDADEEIAKITGEFSDSSEKDVVESVVIETVDEIMQPVSDITELEVREFNEEITEDTDMIESVEVIEESELFETIEEPDIYEDDALEIEPEVEAVEEAVEEAIEEDLTSTLIPKETFDFSDMEDSSFEVAPETPADAVIESANTSYLYYGDLDDDGVRNGNGRTCTDNNRTAYEGEYKDNKRDGKGAYYYKDGTLCYYGEWKNNKREGFGVGVSSFDKSVHVGKFVENKPVDDGVRFNKDGEVSFVKRVLSNGVTVVISFDGDKMTVTKYNSEGEVISENTSNLMYF